MPIKLWIVLFLCAAVCGTATTSIAQTNPTVDWGHIGPSNAEVAGIIIGAAAVIGVVIYVVIPKQKTIEGCVEAGDGGLTLKSEKAKATYSLATGNISLQPGRRVTLKGKFEKKTTGLRGFEVRKLVKDEGACGEHSLLLTPALSTTE
jgi:hypothetical protein